VAPPGGTRVTYGSRAADGGRVAMWPRRALLAYGTEHASRICCGVRHGPRPRCGFSIGRISEKGRLPVRRVSRIAPDHRDTSPGGSCGTPGAGSPGKGAYMQAKCPQEVRLTAHQHVLV